MKLDDAEGTIALVAGGLALLAVVYVLSKVSKRGAHDAAQSVAGGAAGAVVGATTGVADGVSQAIGIPDTEQTITDPNQARWVIDNFGYWEASFWTSASALARGAWMDAGTGSEPPANSPFMLAHSQGLDLGGAYQGDW